VVGLFLFLLFKYYRRVDVWHPNIVRLTAIGGIEIVLINVMHFSVTQLDYGRLQLIPSNSFHKTCMALAILMIVLASLYTLLRLWAYPIGGLNCLKKLAIAIVTALIAHQNVKLMLLPVEVVYAVARIFVERTHTNALLVVLYAE